MTAIFTPGYAAAEQFTSSKLGPWTDIYGLAATLYHAITGQIPPSAIERILKDTYQPLSELQPRRLSAGAARRHRCRAGGARRRIGRRASPNGATCCGPSERVGCPGGDPRRAQAGPPGSRREPEPAGPRHHQGPGAVGRGGGGDPACWPAAATSPIMANTPATVGTAALNLSAEQLEQALAERRKADALAAEKRRLEEEARQKAEADAEAKRQAEAELRAGAPGAAEGRGGAGHSSRPTSRRGGRAAPIRRRPGGRRPSSARPRKPPSARPRPRPRPCARPRRKPEEGGRRRRGQAAGRRGAGQGGGRTQAGGGGCARQGRGRDGGAAQASEEAQRKAEAEAAAQREAGRGGRRQGEAEARQGDAAEPKAKAEAEAAEKALRLEQADRQRLQVALTSLGFDTRGSDGVFGPRSREMIAGWQKKRATQPATGFLTAAQQTGVAEGGSGGVAQVRRRAEESRRAEEGGGRKKAEDEAKARGKRTAAPGPSPAATLQAPPQRSRLAHRHRQTGCGAGPIVAWKRTFTAIPTSLRDPQFTASLDMQLANGSGSWKSSGPISSNGFTQEIRVSAGPTESTVTRIHSGQSYMGGSQAGLSGRYDGNAIRASGREKGTGRYCTFVLTRACFACTATGNTLGCSEQVPGCLAN